MTLLFPHFLLFVFPQRRPAESSAAAATDCPADIDRRGRLSLQEANNEEEVKIQPVNLSTCWYLFRVVRRVTLNVPDGKKKIKSMNVMEHDL